jgi:arylsulfatase A-like enzyme
MGGCGGSGIRVNDRCWIPSSGGVFALAALLALIACSAGDSGRGDVPRNLILISLDTLRADRLGAYGYDRDTSPALDALAARGARFETVIAESNWTLPSHVTLMSGLPPQIHGVVIPDQAPSADVPLLAEILREQGFRTVGLTAGRFLTRRYGFDRGFEVFNDGDLSFARALAIARKRLGGFAEDERFFLFVHSYDIHCPYDPPKVYARRFETRSKVDHVPTQGRCGNPHFNRMKLSSGQARFLSDRYDAGIRYADDLLAKFLADLDHRGQLDDTLVVVVSDHGEEFMEHGKVGHRGTLYMQSLRVPWLLAGPGVPEVVVDEPVGLADVMPTLLELLEVPAVPTRGGSKRSLLLGERGSDPQRLVFSQNDWGLRLYSAVVGDRQIIVDDIRGKARFYDWRADPDEQLDLAGKQADKELNHALWLRARSEFERRKQDPGRFAAEALGDASTEQREQLEALGYIEP